MWKRLFQPAKQSQRLALAEETYRSLVEQASDGIVVTDTNAICLDVNTAGCEMIGYEKSEILGHSVLEFIDPEDLSSTPPRLNQIRKSSGFISERRLVRKDGTKFPVEIHAKPLPDGRIIGIYRDLRERHSYQHLLRALAAGTAEQTGEEFFRSLVENLARALQARCALVGELVATEELSIQTHAIWIDGKEAATRRILVEGTPFQQAIQDGQAIVSDEAFRTFPHDPLVQEINARSFFGAALRDVDGSDLGVLAVLDDKPLGDMEQPLSVLSIFASRASAELVRLRSEEALRQSEKRQRALLEAIPDTLFVMTLDGIYIDYHTQDEARLRLPPQEFLGRNFREVMAPELIPQIEQAFEALRKGEKPKVFEYSSGRNGEERHYEVRHALVDDELVLAMLRDITVRKTYDAEIKRLNENLERLVQERTAQLQAANQELESFAYAVSHDLRAPMRAIHANAEILKEDLADRATEEDLHSIERITSRAEEMSNLIDGLLKLSRIMRTELKQEDLDLSAIATDLVAELRPDDRKVEVMIEPDLRAKGDRALITAALGNLLENAFKFSSKVSSAKVEFGSCSHSGKKCLFVRDNGAGFNMKHVQKLFGPFERLHAPGEFEGTGIGLATVQRIVRRHRGEIWAESEPGEGATFYFTLG